MCKPKYVLCTFHRQKLIHNFVKTEYYNTDITAMDRVHETTTCFLVCPGDLGFLDVFTDTSDRFAAGLTLRVSRLFYFDNLL